MEEKFLEIGRLYLFKESSAQYVLERINTETATYDGYLVQADTHFFKPWPSSASTKSLLLSSEDIDAMVRKGEIVKL